MTPRAVVGILVRCGVIYYLAGGWGIGVLAWLVYFGRREPTLEWLAPSAASAIDTASD
jgi:hypothetical protein